MKNKLGIIKFGGSAVFAFLTLTFNLLLSILLRILIWFWFLPNLSIFFPGLVPVLENAYGTNQMHTYYIINSICAIITILPASTLACRLLRGRRKAFSNYDKCKMSYKEGLLDYWKNNGLTDAILFAATAIILAIVFASSQKLPTVIYRAPDGIGYISLFPLAFAIFEQIGTFFGGLLLLVLLELAMLGGVFFAQKRWRAVYFVEE